MLCREQKIYYLLQVFIVKSGAANNILFAADWRSEAEVVTTSVVSAERRDVREAASVLAATDSYERRD